MTVLDAARAASLLSVARLVDRLEDQPQPGPLTLDAVLAAAGPLAADVQAALDADLLLVDHRQLVDAASGQRRATVLCRLNRRHPLARRASEPGDAYGAAGSV